MIKIKAKDSNLRIKFPTSFTEFDKRTWDTITDSIYLNKHYCVIALAFKTKLFDFCASINNNRDTMLSVTPILAKIDRDDAEMIGAKVGRKVIIDRTSLERGHHINVPTIINSTNARNYFNNNPELLKAIITNTDKDIVYDVDKKEYTTAAKVPNIIILEFKICPVNDIVASLPIDYHIYDEFLLYKNDKDVL